MSGNEVQIGIDHGTTNSSIAFVRGSDAIVVDSPSGSDGVMPSAVFIDKSGRILVGNAAVNAMVDVANLEDGDGYSGYKLRIGEDDRYEFKAAHKLLTPADLGGLVISELVKSYREYTGESPDSAVITVPAMFSQRSCEGTRVAARNAGLSYYPLLMEPVAASIAYGLQSVEDQGNWIVFDMGGGTLDVSLMQVRDRKMIVPEGGHAGDNTLGGRKFDRELLAYVLQELAQKYDMTEFKEGNSRYRTAWRKLELCVERAKIDLSSSAEAIVERDRPLFRDSRGADVHLHVPITRELYHRLIAPDIDKAVRICQSLLRSNGLDRERVRVLLIGGPTYTPYLREMLANSLRVELDTTVDPMIAVAKGAALHASALEVPDEIYSQRLAPRAKTSAVELRLAYEKKSRTASYVMEGDVVAIAGGVKNLFVEVKRQDGGWASGLIPVGSDGAFSVTLLLADCGTPIRSAFVTRVLDHTGAELARLDEPTIWYPIVDASISLARSLRIGTSDNRTHLLVKHGTPLPATGYGTFVTTETIRSGNVESALRIPVFEGVRDLMGEEVDLADCNIHVGSLVVDGTRFERDLPSGADVDVTVAQDESRQIAVEASIPWLSKDFAASFDPTDVPVAKFDELAARFEALRESIAACQALQAQFPLERPGETLLMIAGGRVLERIGEDLDRATQGERDSMTRAADRVVEMAATVNRLQASQTVARICRFIEILEPLVEDNEADQLLNIKKAFAVARSNDNRERLVEIEEEADELDWVVRRQYSYELSWALVAIPYGYATPEQIAAYKEAQAAFEDLEKSQRCSLEQLKRVKAGHARLRRVYPQLDGWVAAKQQAHSQSVAQTEDDHRALSTIGRRRDT